MTQYTIHLMSNTLLWPPRSGAAVKRLPIKLKAQGSNPHPDNQRLIEETLGVEITALAWAYAFL